MSPKEVLTLQALKLKQLETRGSSNPGPLIDAVLSSDTPEVKAEFRNICAMVSVPLFEKVESLCGLLDMSKREFVELALVQYLETARLVLDEVQPLASKE